MEKGAGEQFEFKNYAKFWFNANDIPPVDYIGDEAFFNRFILIEFPNQFKNTTEEFMLKFWESLTEPDEIQGIIHEAMKGDLSWNQCPGRLKVGCAVTVVDGRCTRAVLNRGDGNG